MPVARSARRRIRLPRWWIDHPAQAVSESKRSDCFSATLRLVGVMNGRLLDIYYASEKGTPMECASTIEAIAGRGLAGDRYERAAGTYSHYPGAHDVTLFEIEAAWDFERFSGIALHPAQTRRNLITEGVCLSDLIDREFTIGPVRLRGLRPCPPCSYLSQMLGLPILLRGLARSGGIYASVIHGGELTIGDAVSPVSEPTAL